MTLAFTWIGHSTFLLEAAGKTILIDPFITHNPLTDKTPDDFNPDVILLTHAHGDHVGDTAEGVAHDLISIAQRSDALIIANNEMCGYLSKQGLKNLQPGNPGGTVGTDFVRVKFTKAFHSSSWGDGTYAGQPNGLIIQMGGKTLYHAGDTDLFSDMALIGDGGLDVAFVPIGDVYTMGVDDSIKAVQLLKPRAVMPIHYNTFPPIAQDAVVWAERINRETDAQPIVIDPGSSYTLE